METVHVLPIELCVAPGGDLLGAVEAKQLKKFAISASVDKFYRKEGREVPENGYYAVENSTSYLGVQGQSALLRACCALGREDTLHYFKGWNRLHATKLFV